MRIKEIAKVRRGASPRPIDDPKYFGGEVGWVRIADVSSSGKYLKETSQYVSPLGESYSVRVNKGDLIISIAGSVGKAIIVDMPACIHDGFVQIYDIKETDTEFLYYQLKFLEKSLYRFGQSGTQTNLNRDIVADIEFTWLTKPEQTRIAEILSTADEAIAHTEALIAKYQRIKTGLMQDLLTKGIDENGNIRCEATHQFKDSPLGRIPKEWECEKLISFCQKIQDGTHFSPKTDANGTFKYITSKNIRMGYLDLTNLEFVDEVSHNKIYKRCSVELGDVLLTKDGASTGNTGQTHLN
jgi:type I restriction enzyme S subunit